MSESLQDQIYALSPEQPTIRRDYRLAEKILSLIEQCAINYSLLHYQNQVH